jgi:hypothetical protein
VYIPTGYEICPDCQDEFLFTDSEGKKRCILCNHLPCPKCERIMDYIHLSKVDIGEGLEYVGIESYYCGDCNVWADRETGEITKE